MIAGGKGISATSLTVSGNVLDPSMIKKEDIIGAYNPSTGAETGAEVIRQVYPKLGIVPGLLIAPEWSQEPEVGVALAAKAALLNGVFKAMALVDLDTTKATKYTDTKKVKEDSGFTSKFCYPLWPKLRLEIRFFPCPQLLVRSLLTRTQKMTMCLLSLHQIKC